MNGQTASWNELHEDAQKALLARKYEEAESLLTSAYEAAHDSAVHEDELCEILEQLAESFWYQSKLPQTNETLLELLAMAKQLGATRDRLSRKRAELLQLASSGTMAHATVSPTATACSFVAPPMPSRNSVRFGGVDIGASAHAVAKRSRTRIAAAVQPCRACDDLLRAATQRDGSNRCRSLYTD